MAQRTEQQDTEAVNRAFSKQAPGYDDHDRQNLVLTDMRLQVWAHVAKYLQPHSAILELNAGTGIDACHFAAAGHEVVATDLSDGMVAVMRRKAEKQTFIGQLEIIQTSYENLEIIQGRKFDFVFSNFGGLNCISDLSRATQHLSVMLNPGAHVTWVVMPPVYAWEWLGVIKFNFKSAFRRFRKNGVIAHLEGEHFKTYYHSLRDLESAFGPAFELVASEGLCVLSPPPHRGDFPVRYSALYKILRKADAAIRNSFPFNRTGDHIIATFRLK